MEREGTILHKRLGPRTIYEEIFTSDGTFNVPEGVYFVNLFMVGGGAGMAAGSVAGAETLFVYDWPVTPSTAIAVQVGQGGSGTNDGTPSRFGSLSCAAGKTTSGTSEEGGAGQFNGAGGNGTSAHVTIGDGYSLSGKVVAIPGAMSGFSTPFADASGGGASWGPPGEANGGAGGGTSGEDGIVKVRYYYGKRLMF
jgi:hypothetical protein